MACNVHFTCQKYMRRYSFSFDPLCGVSLRASQPSLARTDEGECVSMGVNVNVRSKDWNVKRPSPGSARWRVKSLSPEDVPVVVEGSGQSSRLGQCIQVGLHVLRREPPAFPSDAGVAAGEQGLQSLEADGKHRGEFMRLVPSDRENI